MVIKYYLIFANNNFTYDEFFRLVDMGGFSMENSVHTKEKLQSAIMLGSFSFTMIAFMLPIYTKMLGGNAVSIGGLFSIFSIVTLLLRPFIGKGIDSYGRKNF